LTSVHASAVLIGSKAVLIRGPAGAGKSRLVWDILQAAAHGTLPFARLVADDRVHLEVHGSHLLAWPAPALAGLLEIRGVGIRRLPYEPIACVDFVIDLAAEDAARCPERDSFETRISGVDLPRLAVGPNAAPLALLLAFRTTLPGSN
jgi:serine kinase of HPr protein (carbohydrate metabolism regulator)